MTTDIAEIIHTSGGYCDANGKSHLLDAPSTHNRSARQRFVEWSRHKKRWGPDTDSASLLLEITDSVLLLQKDGSSKTNHHHAVMVLILAKDTLSFGALPQQLMVIAMYRSQVALIKRLFQHYHIDVAVNTVDSSEGKEAPIVIVDLTTPARKHSEIGFLRDQRRINVAFSRAMDGRIVLGSAVMANLPTQTLGEKMLIPPLWFNC
jgi:hypothetical protein